MSCDVALVRRGGHQLIPSVFGPSSTTLQLVGRQWKPSHCPSLSSWYSPTCARANGGRFLFHPTLWQLSSWDDPSLPRLVFNCQFNCNEFLSSRRIVGRIASAYGKSFVPMSTLVSPPGLTVAGFVYRKVYVTFTHKYLHSHSYMSL